MNGRMSKKLHKEAVKLAKANWFEYLNAILSWPYIARLRFAWYIATPWHKGKKV